MEQTANLQVMNMVAQSLPLRLRSGQALFTPLALPAPFTLSDAPWSRRERSASGIEGSLLALSVPNGSNGGNVEGSLPALRELEGSKEPASPNQRRGIWKRLLDVGIVAFHAN